MPDSPLPTLVADEQFGSAPDSLRLSIVVVAWRDHERLTRCVDRLAELVPADVEVLLVGNAADLRASAAALVAAGGHGRVIQLATNDGPSPARNVGAARAVAPVVAFLDDDARIEPGWVAAMVEGVGRPGAVAVRGRILPESRPVLTRLARGYDLGDERRVAFLNTEGNMAIDAAAFAAVGGFAPMFGHEGVELSVRVRQRFGGRSIWYEPGAVIRHDYVDGVGAYLGKRFRHGRNLRRLGAANVRLAARVRPSTPRRDWWLVPMRWIGDAAELVGFAWGIVASRTL